MKMMQFDVLAEQNGESIVIQQAINPLWIVAIAKNCFVGEINGEEKIISQIGLITGQQLNVPLDGDHLAEMWQNSI
jgi:hypothetical protein